MGKQGSGNGSAFSVVSNNAWLARVTSAARAELTGNIYAETPSTPSSLIPSVILSAPHPFRYPLPVGCRIIGAGAGTNPTAPSSLSRLSLSPSLRGLISINSPGGCRLPILSLLYGAGMGTCGNSAPPCAGPLGLVCWLTYGLKPAPPLLTALAGLSSVDCAGHW